MNLVSFLERDGNWEMCDTSAENGPLVSYLTHLVLRAVVLSVGLGLLLFDIDLKRNGIRLDSVTGRWNKDDQAWVKGKQNGGFRSDALMSGFQRILCLDGK